MIFLADKSLAANTPLDDLVKGKIGQDEAWAKWHWKGSAKEMPAKLAQWERNVGPYSNPADMPLEPEQLPSPNEQRMKFAQQDPRRVDLTQQMAKAPQAPQETQYASMEDLLMDRDLLGRSLLG